MQDEFQKLMAEEEGRAIAGSGRYLAMANSIIEASDKEAKESLANKAPYDQICLYDIAQSLRGIMLLQGAELDLQERLILLAAKEKDDRS